MSSKKESFFWTSYSDLMTSLFFVMLVLFVLTIALLHKRMVDIENERKATQEQLDKIEQIQKATEKIDPTYFAYDSQYKRHTLKNIIISFRAKSSDINDINIETQQKLIHAGEAIRAFMESAKDSLPDANYLLIIEGQSSKDSYAKNFELSYERALSLVRFWKANGIQFEGLDNCELMISGSGFSSPFRSNNEVDNQRFVIHVIPKPGSFDDEKNNALNKVKEKDVKDQTQNKQDSLSACISEVESEQPKQRNDDEKKSDMIHYETKTLSVGGVPFKMIFVEGGSFDMGATAEQGDDVSENEKPIHRVTLNSFFIGETEVTQALWKAVMGDNPSNFQGNNLPVERVTWDDCRMFIDRLNALTAMNFRLPMEVEWEFAARGGTKSLGFRYSGSNDLNDVAWYSGNSSQKTHTVKMKEPNELGIYDMSGNVCEWCQDSFYEYGKKEQTPTKKKIWRGGGWRSKENFCRNAYRNKFNTDQPSSAMGLRLCTTSF